MLPPWHCKQRHKYIYTERIYKQKNAVTRLFSCLTQQMAAAVPCIAGEDMDVRSHMLPSKGEVNGVLARLQGQGLQLRRAGHKRPSAAWRWSPLLGSYQLTNHAGCLRGQL